MALFSSKQLNASAARIANDFRAALLPDREGDKEASSTKRLRLQARAVLPLVRGSPPESNQPRTRMSNIQNELPTPPRTWHVEIDGQRKGPMTKSQIDQLIGDGKLSRDSLVWHTGAPDWQPLSATEFSAGFANTPPPLTGKAIPNGLVWTLAFAPLLGAFLGGLFAGMLRMDPNSFWWVTLALNVVLSLMDERRLKGAGYDTARMGSAWLVPVYLYKRAQVLNQNLAYFITWVVCFAVSLIFG